MGDLDIRLLLCQLRLKPEDTDSMECELVEWFMEWHEKRETGTAGTESGSYAL